MISPRRNSQHRFTTNAFYNAAGMIGKASDHEHALLHRHNPDTMRTSGRG
jgi:hypothetical protein